MNRLLLPRLPPARVVSGMCAWVLFGAVSVGCGDDVADPIVRLAQMPGGSGSGGQDNADIGDLCAPCSSRTDCNAMESCLVLTRGGARFCTRDCGAGDARCPQGYVCANVEGGPSLECVPQAGGCGRTAF